MMEVFSKYFEKLMLLVMSRKCYHTLLIDLNFTDVPCLKAIVSKGLGLGIIAGSILVKVPQIAKILNNGSSEGISFSGQLFELYGILASVAYSYAKSFPFSAWGEGLFMMIQTAIISALVLRYNVNVKSSLLFIVVLSILSFVLMSGITSIEILFVMQALSVPFMFIGKMTQAYNTYRVKTMGQQSLITCALLFLGSLARVFTSIQETGDLIVIITYIMASLGNFIIVSQFYIYKPPSPLLEKHKVS